MLLFKFTSYISCKKLTHTILEHKITNDKPNLLTYVGFAI